MKKKLVAQLVSGALGAVAVSFATAGVINPVTVNIAREVVVHDDQKFGLPQVSYQYNQSTLGGSNAQQFQIQLQLQDGLQWNSPPTAADIMISGQDANDSTKSVCGNFSVAPGSSQTLVECGAANVATNYFTLVGGPTIASSNGGTNNTIYINIDSIPGKSVRTPTIRISGGGIGKLKSFIDGGVANGCLKSRSTGIAYAHIQTRPADGGPAAVTWNPSQDETLTVFGGSRNNVIQISDNLDIVITPSKSTLKLNVGNNSVDFINTAVATVNTQFGNIADVLGSFVNSTTVNLGSVYVKQVSLSGVDKDGKTAYNLAALSSNTSTTLANNQAGRVEWKSLNVTVSASTALPTGSTIKLCDQPAGGGNCGAALSISSTTGTTYNIGFNYPMNQSTGLTNQPGATSWFPVYVIATVPGTEVINNTSFTAVATLTKAPDTNAGDYVYESNDVCSGNLAPIGGGIRIDVRNYVPAKVGTSVIRLINNSEVATAEVTGQWINATGQYGNWGKIATLAPREARNILNSDLEAMLVNTSAAAVSASLKGTDVSAGGKPGAANGRLRVSSPVTTLRVQNYYFQNGQWIEWSSAQGADASGNDVGSGALQTNVDYGTATGQDARLGIDGAQ